MPDYTKNLKLYKANPVEDANATFNIDRMLNDNWDALDNEAKKQSDALAAHKGDQALHVTQALKDSIQQSAAGLNTHIADQTKHVTQALKDQIGTTAQSLTAHTGNGTIHVTAADKTNWSGKAGTAVATQTANGLMSGADKKKLDGVAASANNYVHPANHPASVITQDASNRFVTDAEKGKWNGKAEASHKHPISDVTNLQTEMDKVGLRANSYIATAATYASGVFTLTVPNYVHKAGSTVTFKAPEVPGSSNSIKIGALSYNIMNLSDDPDISNMWVTGSMVTVTVGDQNKMFLNIIGDVKSPTPNNWTFFRLILENEIWTPSNNGWYRIMVVGKCGNGSNAGGPGYAGFAGGGGGSGGYACSELYLKSNQTISVTVNDNITSFGNYLSATAGKNGEEKNGGMYGQGSGGNIISLTGNMGGDGGYGSSQIVSQATGKQGNGGGAKGGSITMTDYPGNTPSYRPSGGGGGKVPVHETYNKYIGDISKYSGGSTSNRTTINAIEYPALETSNLFLYGGGNGGGLYLGASYDGGTVGGTGSAGSPACIIIEKGV